MVESEFSGRLEPGVYKYVQIPKGTFRFFRHDGHPEEVLRGKLSEAHSAGMIVVFGDTFRVLMKGLSKLGIRGLAEDESQLESFLSMTRESSKSTIEG